MKVNKCHRNSSIHRCNCFVKISAVFWVAKLKAYLISPKRPTSIAGCNGFNVLNWFSEYRVNHLFSWPQRNGYSKVASIQYFYTNATVRKCNLKSASEKLSIFTYLPMYLHRSFEKGWNSKQRPHRTITRGNCKRRIFELLRNSRTPLSAIKWKKVVWESTETNNKNNRISWNTQSFNCSLR